MKQSWWFLWSWLLIGGLVSYSERGSKTAVFTFLHPKIAYNTVWSLQSVFAGTIHVYWPTNKNATWNQCDMALKHKTAYLKLLSLPLSPLPLFSAHIKNTNAKVWFIMFFLFTTSACWWHFFFCSNMRRSVRVKGVLIVQSTHVVAKFIRSMSHSVTCNDLIGLLKSCSVFWALGRTWIFLLK